jgi:hypothetical protein
VDADGLVGADGSGAGVDGAADVDCAATPVTRPGVLAGPASNGKKANAK